MERRPEAGVTHLATPSDREIVTSRVFDAPRDRLWRAFTEPAELARWWGRGHRLDIKRMEVTRGGHWRFVEHAPDGTHGFEGRYREVTPPERLSMTFDWDGRPGHVSVTTITFEDSGKLVMGKVPTGDSYRMARDSGSSRSKTCIPMASSSV